MAIDDDMSAKGLEVLGEVSGLLREGFSIPIQTSDPEFARCLRQDVSSIGYKTEETAIYDADNKIFRYQVTIGGRK